MKILYISDIPDWVFHKTGLALQKYGRNSYEIRFGRKSRYKKCWKNLDKFDLVLFPIDVRPDKIIKDHQIVVPPDKLVMMIRCDVFQLCKPSRLNYYESTQLMSRRVKAFMCANQKLNEVFSKRYNVPCYYAPGGVDTDVFILPENKMQASIPRVGWAGSNLQKERRGIHLIKEAVNKLGWIWCPAYRESKMRTKDEMVKYYQEEIDVYIDCDNAPGRQNGLLEAGACGLPLVCTLYGIGRELIQQGIATQTGRDVNSIIESLKKAANSNIDTSKLINQYWSWKHHVELWEEIFRKVKYGAKT